jgi:hypothetical protein
MYTPRIPKLGIRCLPNKESLDLLAEQRVKQSLITVLQYFVFNLIFTTVTERASLFIISNVFLDRVFLGLLCQAGTIDYIGRYSGT